ncbi:hypothetical protein ABZ345_41530 [Lentzea sp. NPDC005914]|uniref:hypothetical protein n=1 Tax=Lentzea sp. NPDC005914 TaxID=3154572 RepID=UPI0033F8AA42
MGDQDREAARRAVREARLEAQRPWWQKRFTAWLFSVPSRFWRSLRWWGAELSEVLLWWIVLAVLFGVGLLGWWVF